VTAEVSAKIGEALASSAIPLTVREIAQRLDIPPSEVAEIVWAAPQSFSWQPGGRWSLAAAKTTVRPPVEPGNDDARIAVLSPQEGVELRAIRLAGGATLRVIRRPLDTAALFTVKAMGSDLQLILNSSHEMFEKLPMPFEADGEGDYKTVVELLLAAWAVHEAEAPAAAQRGLEDARLFWGRRLLELLDSET
jgi:hypothetical protein